jgi:hypothetical protein
MRNTLCTLLALFCCQLAFSQQEAKLFNLGLETRLDYQREYIDDEAVNDNSGFKGKYLNIRIDGQLNDKFSYSYRQRLNKEHKDASYFDATDWIYLKYKANDNWGFSAGKQVVAIGGYEYDRAPIDIYFASEYWNNIRCYALGVNAIYTFNGGNDQLQAQICESPFIQPDEDMYAYNLFWSGRFYEDFETLYSVNMLEYLPGKFINYISLGNKLVSENDVLEFDIMNRDVEGHSFFFKNYSLNLRYTYNFCDKFKALLMGSHDVNKTEVAGDYCVLPGTEITRSGLGLEYYPMGNRSLRLHLFYFRMLGDNSNVAGTLVDNQNIFSFGVKWNLDLLSFKRK